MMNYTEFSGDAPYADAQYGTNDSAESQQEAPSFMNLMKKYWWAILLLVLVLFPTKSKKRYYRRAKRKVTTYRKRRAYKRASKPTKRKFSKRSRR